MIIFAFIFYNIIISVIDNPLKRKTYFDPQKEQTPTNLYFYLTDKQNVFEGFYFFFVCMHQLCYLFWIISHRRSTKYVNLK